MSDSPADTPGGTDATTTDDPDRRARGRGQGEPDGQKWLSGLVALIGLWIAASPFVYETAQSIQWNNVIVGAAILLVAAYNYYRIVNGRTSHTAAMSLAALLGLWIVVSPFALEGEFAMDAIEIADDGLVWSNVVSGLAGAVLSAYVAYAAGRRVPTGTAAETR